MSVDLFLPFFIVFATLLFIKFRNGAKNLPPGPWGLPILGHLIFLGMRPHRTLMAWKKKYGPIIYTRMGSFPCVFLCDPKIIKQAFAMAEFAGRGDLEAIMKIEDRKGIALAEGPRQTEMRHFALTTLKDFGVGRKGIEEHIQNALGQFLDNIKTTGENGRRAMDSSHIASPYVISSLYRVLITGELTAEQVAKIGGQMDKVSELGSILGQLAIFMPWIETLAKIVTFGQGSVTAVRNNNFKVIYQFMDGQVNKRKASWVKGQPRDVVDAYLDMVDEKADLSSIFHPSHGTVKYFSGDLVIGGVHTTSTSMEWVFLYMATFPAVQKKLQEEIDSVVGPSRIPAMSDRPQMPYVDAAINELLRLSSIFPLAFDHKCVKEVTLQGYTIPKGTLVFGNLYGVHHDPEIWGDDVEEYKPERWVGEDGRKLRSGHLLSFSTGKRNCIGETLARDTLFIFITGIFQRFTVSFENGGKGPGLEPILGIGLSPPNFKIVFTPRDTD